MDSGRRGAQIQARNSKERGLPRGPAGEGRAVKTVAGPRHFDFGLSGTFNSFQMAMPISSRT